MRGTRTCAHCGRLTGDYAGGHASVNGVPVCHPNATGRPDCYRLITVYGQTIGHLNGAPTMAEPPSPEPSGRPAALGPVASRWRWRLKQYLAGRSGRFYGDGGTIHDSGSLDVEIAGGKVVAVWFRCQRLPFNQQDVDAFRAYEMRDADVFGVVITGVEVNERPDRAKR